MKDLDRTQVYDLRGITEKQARELLDWLVENDSGWTTPASLDGYYGFYVAIREYPSFKYTGRDCWHVSVSKHTTHISTLFEKSYEQQLQEAKKKLEHYKKEVERLGNESKPKINDICKLWNDVESDFVIGILTDIDESDFPYQVRDSAWFKNAKKLTEQEVIDLLFKKS